VKLGLVDTFRVPCALSYQASVEGFVRVQGLGGVQREQVNPIDRHYLACMDKTEIRLEFQPSREERRIPNAQHRARPTRAGRSLAPCADKSEMSARRDWFKHNASSKNQHRFDDQHNAHRRPDLHRLVLGGVWRVGPIGARPPTRSRSLITPTVRSRRASSAQMATAGADTIETTWHGKRLYAGDPTAVSWRPITAIRLGGDGDPATAADPAWTPYIPTQSHPDYADPQLHSSTLTKSSYPHGCINTSLSSWLNLQSSGARPARPCHLRRGGFSARPFNVPGKVHDIGK
jgi:hypothetical protein